MEKILIGKIVNTHGIKGELKVLSETDFKAERYRLHHPVYIQTKDGLIPFRIQKYRPHQGFDLLTLEGMEDINLVEGFRGCPLFADDEPIEKLPENEFRISSLLQTKILQNGRPSGIVSGIRTYPQGDYLEITKTDGTSALIPFRDEFILKVDASAGVIEIVDMEGLL